MVVVVGLVAEAAARARVFVMVSIPLHEADNIHLNAVMNRDPFHKGVGMIGTQVH